MQAAPLLPSSGEPVVCSTEWALWIREDYRECVCAVHIYSPGRWWLMQSPCRKRKLYSDVLSNPVCSLDLCQDSFFSVILLCIDLSFTLPWWWILVFVCFFFCSFLIFPCNLGMHFLILKKSNTDQVVCFSFAVTYCFWVWPWHLNTSAIPDLQALPHLIATLYPDTHDKSSPLPDPLKSINVFSECIQLLNPFHVSIQ